MGKRKEALDALLSAMAECDNVYTDAKLLMIEDEVDAFKKQMADILKSEYDVSYEEADAINQLKPVYYTIAVENILIGANYDEGFAPEKEEEVAPEPVEEKKEPELDDILPEEQSILNEMEN